MFQVKNTLLHHSDHKQFYQTLLRRETHFDLSEWHDLSHNSMRIKVALEWKACSVWDEGNFYPLKEICFRPTQKDM